MRSALLGRLWLGVLAITLTAASVTYSPDEARAVDPTFTFTGGGWGHGVGLSQWGAQGYAKQGWKYDRILTHYYSGTRIVTKPTVTMRVNVEAGAAARSQWRIKSGSNADLIVAQESDPKVRHTLDSRSAAWITTANGDTLLRADDAGVPGKVLKSFSGGCYAMAGGLVQMLGTSGPYNHSGVRWRGTIHFKPKSTTSNASRAVNYVGLEQYLYGVVPRESPSSWHAEALKAQAVAARSYAYQSGVEKRTLYCTTKSQVYNGHSRPGHRHEAASTNAAVDATRDKVVWYGSERQPVKTYFSSSSGGHTADIEDVWTGATAKPYYRGVADADSDSPHFKWTAGPLTGAQVASMLRDRDNGSDNAQRLDYSVKAPATVTEIRADRAKSGFTHHVSVTWSNGRTFRIAGTTLQSALRLRSSKYGVKRSVPTLSTARIQEGDAKLAWYGPWNRVSNSRLSGGKMRHATVADASVTMSFTGTGVRWVAKRGPGYGKAAVYLDGKHVKTVDLYAPSVQYGKTVFSSTSLSSGKHSLDIKVLREKRASAKGYAVSVDALEVLNGTASNAAPVQRRYEQDQTRLARVGAWKPIDGSRYSGASMLRTSSADAAFYCTFYGNGVTWVGTKAASYGRATVSVDGGPPKEVVLTAGATSHRQVVFSANGLDQGKVHTLVIRAKGPASGGSGFVSIDGIDVNGGWLLAASPPTKTLDEKDGAVRWSSGWTTAAGKSLHGGSHRTSSASGSKATLTFDGTAVTWLAKKAPSHGLASVYLDGTRVKTVDLFRQPAAYQQTVWSSGRLPSGRHTLEIKVAGKRSPSSSGNAVSIDAFRVDGRASK